MSIASYASTARDCLASIWAVLATPALIGVAEVFNFVTCRASGSMPARNRSIDFYRAQVCESGKFQRFLTMQTQFRNATVMDAERIADIYLAARKQYVAYAPLAHTDEQIRAWVRESLIPSGGVTVAVIDGAVVGFIATSCAETSTWIDQLYVDRSFIGSGLGSALLRFAKARLASPIRLYTFQQNERARRFYLRHGFREIEFTDGSGNEEKTPDVLMEWAQGGKSAYP